MNITLNEKELRLKELLMVLPPDFDSVENLLNQDAYTVENISKVGTDFVWECVEEWWGYWLDKDSVLHEGSATNLHSTYLCKVLSFLLQYGLDPNAIFEEENIMNNLKYLNTGFVAADALVLLFEHGGNPNLVCDGCSIFEEIDFDVLFDASELSDYNRYAPLVHCWMVYLAFGATNPDGSLPVTVFRDFDIRKLKDHRQFYFGITKGDPWPDIHIFSKKDMWEVVRA